MIISMYMHKQVSNSSRKSYYCLDRITFLCVMYIVHTLRFFTTNWNKSRKNRLFTLKFGYSEKATKFEKIFHLEFDATHTAIPYRASQGPNRVFPV